MTQKPPDNTLSYASTPEGIREIAGRQRAIILCIVAGIILYVALAAGQTQLPLAVKLLLLMALLACNITATVFVFLLTTKLYGTGVGVLLGVLTLLPCIGLITLLIINGKATAILQQNGIKVGLLGATLPDHLR
jgi:hypothetical protein